jgi:hypothetical protein
MSTGDYINTDYSELDKPTQTREQRIAARDKLILDTIDKLNPHTDGQRLCFYNILLNFYESALQDSTPVAAPAEACPCAESDVPNYCLVRSHGKGSLAPQYYCRDSATAAPAPQAWIPVSERLPGGKDLFREMEVKLNTGDVTTARRGWDEWVDENERCVQYVTHWREIGAAPQGTFREVPQCLDPKCERYSPWRAHFHLEASAPEPPRVASTCPNCQHYVDTPNHELGCALQQEAPAITGTFCRDIDPSNNMLIGGREQEIAERWEFVDGVVCDEAYEGSGFVNIPGEGSIHLTYAENAQTIVNRANATLAELTALQAAFCDHHAKWLVKFKAEEKCVICRNIAQADMIHGYIGHVQAAKAAGIEFSIGSHDESIADNRRAEAAESQLARLKQALHYAAKLRALDAIGAKELFELPEDEQVAIVKHNYDLFLEAPQPQAAREKK